MANELDQLNLTQAGTLPPELYAQQQALNRQQQLAGMLMQQNQQPQGQMISGRYVKPSFFQALQPVANMLTGAYLAKQGDTKAAALAEQLRAGKEAEKQAALQEIKSGNAVGALELPNVYGGATPYTAALIEQAIPKKPSTIQEYEYAAQNPGFAGYQFGLKRAGAPSVINQVGASLAEQAGKMFNESKASTVGAYGAITSADKILNSTNKAVTGPLANARLTGLQIADTLGVAGKGEKEKIAATREVLQETGKLALAAPPKGQGQVSNYERDLYQRAASGDINFTPTELNLIARRAREAGEYQIQQHNELLQTGAELGPDVGKMAKLYRVNPPQSTQPAAPPATPQTSNKVKFLGFE